MFSSSVFNSFKVTHCCVGTDLFVDPLENTGICVGLTVVAKSWHCVGLTCVLFLFHTLGCRNHFGGDKPL